ncbi:MAG TPA: hypothetical protein VM324_06210 [Egibacteraceae bacterium]|nr:hypothetical protein [Egibacteraceae bacterium]
MTADERGTLPHTKDKGALRMDRMTLGAVFALWSLAFLAAAVGYWYVMLGRNRAATLALAVCVGAFTGMFRVGREQPRSS